MSGLMALTYLRLFIRFTLGLLLVSVAVSKITHRQAFRRAIQDYQIIPTTLDSRLHLTDSLSFFLPPLELLVNLHRQRFALSCGCGSVLGDHPISWWMVGRNALLLAGLILLLLTPMDPFELAPFADGVSHATLTDWFAVALPIVGSAALILAVIALLNAAHVLWDNTASQ